MASPNPNPKRIPILDSFPNAPVRHRRGRGGRLRSLGSVRGGSSGSITPSSSFSTISRGFITKKSSSKGFAIRGMIAEVAIALRASSGTSLSLERTQATLSKRKVVEEDSENDEDEDTSLIARPRVRRHIVSEDEAEVTAVRASLTEPVRIPSDDETTTRDTNESIQRLFVSGFESGELGPVLDEVPFSSFVPPLVSSASFPILSVPAPLSISAPLLVSSSLPASSPSTPVIFTSSTAPPSIAPPPSVQHAGEGSSSRSLAMRSVTLEVPANNSLLRKSGGADAWLRPLIGDIEKKKMSSHSCLTLVNDIVHSTLKQKRSLTSKLAVAKASSSQFEKDKERLECCFSEQLSKSSEEIRELKALLDKKEKYVGELVQNLTQVQADLKISSDKVHALKSSHASLEASLDSHLAEHQVQENFDLDSELAKVLETIERTQQSFDFPSPATEAPVAKDPVNDKVVVVAVEVEGVAIPAPEGEISMTQSMKAETFVTLAPLIEPNTSSPTETALVAASSEVATVPVAVSESEINSATSDVSTPSVTS
ncbi:chitinase-like protein PB1E7.04c [Nicotiana sylvestris]|uniref:chitinase-like protein PB1E7.04c n=1 Tax=Nicotiana sylvestris TaxID=4096 RepID=UPI00388C9995